MTNEKNRPGRDGNRSEPVSSTNPAKEKLMNSAAHTIAGADRQSNDAAVAEAMRSLENDICSLVNMAHVLGDLLDHDLVGYAEDGTRKQMPGKGNVLKVYLGHQQLERLSFCWNNVITRAEQLSDKFGRAWDGVTP